MQSVEMIPLPAAAERLGTSERTLRRWIGQGCPAVRGRRGRGHSTLVSVRQVQAWRDGGRDALVAGLAAKLPDAMAGAVWNAWLGTEGRNDRQALAGAMALAWYVSAQSALDELREISPGLDIPDIGERQPWPIERLRKTATNGLF